MTAPLFRSINMYPPTRPNPLFRTLNMIDNAHHMAQLEKAITERQLARVTDERNALRDTVRRMLMLEHELDASTENIQRLVVENATLRAQLAEWIQITEDVIDR